MDHDSYYNDSKETQSHVHHVLQQKTKEGSRTDGWLLIGAGQRGKTM